MSISRIARNASDLRLTSTPRVTSSAVEGSVPQKSGMASTITSNLGYFLVELVQRSSSLNSFSRIL
eukprot:1483865-Pyramimonas_sp.AAC.1